jgi:hypothetical protein
MTWGPERVQRTGARRLGLDGAGYACGAGRTARRMGAGQIEADRADRACEASHSNARAQRREGVCVRAGAN